MSGENNQPTIFTNTWPVLASNVIIIRVTISKLEPPIHNGTGGSGHYQNKIVHKVENCLTIYFKSNIERLRSIAWRGDNKALRRKESSV